MPLHMVDQQGAVQRPHPHCVRSASAPGAAGQTMPPVELDAVAYTVELAPPPIPDVALLPPWSPPIVPLEELDDAAVAVVPDDDGPNSSRAASMLPQPAPTTTRIAAPRKILMDAMVSRPSRSGKVES